MPVHDWTRVKAGIFHHFHHEWISTISLKLNGGLLPSQYYALAEQISGGRGPDVLTLETVPDPSGNGTGTVAGGGVIALATAPPRVRFTAQSEQEQKRKQVVIHHSSDDSVVALIEIVSPGNKDRASSLRSFVEKAIGFLDAGIHLLVLDLFPPTRHDLQGIHGAIWSEMGEDDFALPTNEPLTLAAYEADTIRHAYIEPTAVGQILPDMPLFLKPGGYVLVPLEATYQAAFAAVPERWRKVLDAQSA